VSYATVQNWLALFERFSLTFSLPTWTEQVDFLIADEQPSRALFAMQRALGIPAVQLVRSASGYRTMTNGDLPLLVAPADTWCAGLPPS